MRTATAATTPAVTHGRARALTVAAGAIAAVIAWAVEDQLLGVHLSVRFGGSHPQVIGPGQFAGVAVAAGLAGWLLLAALSRRTTHARAAWTTAALVALAASLALPLFAATTGRALAGLIAAHLAVGAVVIPGLAATARSRPTAAGPRSGPGR